MVENLLSVRDIYGNTALQLAVTYNAESLPSLTGRFLAQMLNMKNARGDTVLHYAAANKNSLEYLMSMFQESWLAVRNSNGSTVLHIAAFQSPDSLEYLIKTFSGKVKDLLEIKDRDGQTALHLAAQYKSKSLEYLVNVFGDKVFDLKDNNGRTALHVANTDSLQFLVQKFGDRIIEVKNKHGNTVLQYAAAHNPDALKFLIQEFQDKVLKVQNNLGDTALHFAIKNKGSLNLLIGAFREKVLEVKNDANKTILHCVAQYNKDSLLLLIAAFPNKIGSFLNKQDIHGNTVLHYAVAYNKDSLAALIESFPNEVERLLDVQNNYGITALQLAITYHAESLKVLMTERFVHKMLNIQNVYGDTVLHYAAVNTESLKILMNVFQEYGLQIINNDGSTVLHYAAALNKNSLAVLIEMFPNEVKSLLSKKDFHGHTVWHYTINNKDSLALLIASFPNEVESLFNEVYHSIAPNLRQLIDNLLIRFVSSNNVIDSDNNMDIYGAEVGIAIPGITEALSYYYQKQVSLLLKLRLEYAKPGALKSVDVLEASYILQENNADDISAKLSSFILNSEKNTILMPLNIGWKHLVGIAAKKYEGEVVLYYMDSERNPLPESLFAKVRAELESRGYSTEQVIVEVEKQNYSNCGPEVIENLTAFASGKKRTSQEEAVLKHSTLFEEYLLKDSSKGESTSDSSPNDISAHESIIKSMPVLSESATILGNMLFYKISRVSDMKKSIELNIANTNLLVDAKTQAQLIYYYKTGELLPSARSMLERNSAAIQEHYKFFITNETFQVSMPDTLLADGKLEAQVLHYLRTGELFESARSALESGAVRVISQSSTVSEEEVEKTVQLQSLMRTPNRESHNDSGEALDFSEELSTNDSTDGLLYS